MNTSKAMSVEWRQMDLLNEPDRDIRLEKVENLADELIKEDPAIIQQVIKSHRLNGREVELLRELLNVNYILDN